MVAAWATARLISPIDAASSLSVAATACTLTEASRGACKSGTPGRPAANPRRTPRWPHRIIIETKAEDRYYRGLSGATYLTPRGAAADWVRAFMAKIFISHSSADNEAALGVHDWLDSRGWGPVFLDFHSRDGLQPGERWEEALSKAGQRCLAVVVLVSKAWLSSHECMAEYTFARYGDARAFFGRKKIIPILLEEVDLGALPSGLASWQVLRGVDPASLERLEHVLTEAGLSPDVFQYNPQNDPAYRPYRGLQALAENDAAIFFGRDADIVRGLQEIRSITNEETQAPLFVILGASGAGKSSFMRAGLLPRLAREPARFVVLPTISPEPAALSAPRTEGDGRVGLATALFETFRLYGDALSTPNSVLKDIRARGLPFVLDQLRKRVDTKRHVQQGAQPPTVILPIDQGEELFVVDRSSDESRELLAMLGAAIMADPKLLVAITIRTDNYHQLQAAEPLAPYGKHLFDLPTIPVPLMKDVIEGPARIAEPKIDLDPALIVQVLNEANNSSDALPLVAFALERLLLKYGTSNKLTLSDYQSFGGLYGAVAEAYAEIKRNSRLRDADVAAVIVPTFARLGDDGLFLRRLVHAQELTPAKQAICNALVDGRLLVRRGQQDGETLIEVAHEAVLRQWPLTADALERERPNLACIQSVESAARRWSSAQGRRDALLEHSGRRLADAVRLVRRHPEYRERLKKTGLEYLASCRTAQRNRRWATGIGIVVGATAIISYIQFSRTPEQEAGAAILAQQAAERELQKERERVILAAEHYQPSSPVLAPNDRVQALPDRSVFRDCRECPEMTIIEGGTFTMGSSSSEVGHDQNESPQHDVTISRFAVGRFDVTFSEWEACSTAGGCRSNQSPDDAGFGRGRHPVINVTWYDAQEYVQWLSRRTGHTYRLLTEAEWEYVARAGTSSRYYTGPTIATSQANFAHNVERTLPVGSYPPNQWNLFDLAGNVNSWVEDCNSPNYKDAKPNGAAWVEGSCTTRIIRGGSWLDNASILRSARRYDYNPKERDNDLGFRVARTLE
jgi:formylglycine-generating enzyme required for sulfatase activity